MGYDISESLATASSLIASQMAIKQRKYKTQLIHHSDRGIQYCSNDYQNTFKNKKIIHSITESYDPYANAIAERINGIMKHEFLLENYNVDLKTMKPIVDGAVHIYNTKRPHWFCLMNTPEQMHKQSNVKIKTYKKI